MKIEDLPPNENQALLVDDEISIDKQYTKPAAISFLQDNIDLT